jgi:hypothetical protein
MFFQMLSRKRTQSACVTLTTKVTPLIEFNQREISVWPLRVYGLLAHKRGATSGEPTEKKVRSHERSVERKTIKQIITFKICSGVVPLPPKMLEKASCNQTTSISMRENNLYNLMISL